MTKKLVTEIKNCLEMFSLTRSARNGCLMQSHAKWTENRKPYFNILLQLHVIGVFDCLGRWPPS